MLFSQQTKYRGAHHLLLRPLVSTASALIKQPLPSFYIAALGACRTYGLIKNNEL